jgi:hypothetical protein
MVMKNGKFRRILWLAVSVFVMLYAGNLRAEESGKSSLEKGHREVAGTIQTINEDSVVLKTDEGSIRKFSVLESRKEGLRDLKAWDRIFLKMDDGNQIIAIDRSGKDETGKSMEAHQTVTGGVERFDPASATVVLKLKDGSTQSFKMKDAAAAKMGSVAPGTSVKMEIDEESRIMDFERE